MPIAIGFALPALWPAVAILLILWAAVVLFQRPLVALLSGLPVVGGELAKIVGNAIGGLIAWAAEWAAGMVRPLLELISAPVTWIVNLAHGLALTFETLSVELARIASVAIGQVGTLASRVATAVLAVANLSTIVAGLRALVSGVQTIVATLVSRTIPAAIATAETYARAIAGTLVAAASATLSAAIAAIRPWALAAIELALAPVRLAVRLMPEWVQAQIAAAAAVLAGTLGLRVRGVESQVAGVQGQVGAITTALAPLLALELARVVPRVITDVQTMRRQCVDPMCSALGPQLAVLDALNTGATMGLLLALVSSAIADPAGTARTTAGEAGAVRGLANDLVGPVVGVRL